MVDKIPPAEEKFNPFANSGGNRQEEKFRARQEKERKALEKPKKEKKEERLKDLRADTKQSQARAKKEHMHSE